MAEPGHGGRSADDGISALLISVLGAGEPGAGLEHACEACARALPVTGAAISVMTDRTARQTLCASDETATRLEDLQFALGSGPCSDAYRDGGPVLVPDLATPYADVRWPTFAAQAVREGVRATFAFPCSWARSAWVCWTCIETPPARCLPMPSPTR